MEELPIYYLRHNFSGRGEVAPTLLERKFIAFHYANEYHEKIEDYTSFHEGYERVFKITFNAFSRIGKDGVIVVFEYNDPDHFFIASVPKGQSIQPFEYTSTDYGSIIYKVLSYCNPKRFTYARHMVLLALRPIHGTVCQPSPPFQRIVRHLYLGKDLKRSVQLLHPKFLEQLCENFLRSDFPPAEIRILYTFMKTGKTLPIVDIVGRDTSGRMMLVQVTHNTGEGAIDKARKLVSLAQTLPEAVSILFSGKRSLEYEGLNYHFSVQNVFSKFEKSSVPWHRSMLEEMLGIFTWLP
jgi:hypothetical protein